MGRAVSSAVAAAMKFATAKRRGSFSAAGRAADRRARSFRRIERRKGSSPRCGGQVDMRRGNGLACLALLGAAFAQGAAVSEADIQRWLAVWQKREGLEERTINLRF